MNLFALVNGAPWIFGPVTFAGTITFTGSALLADGSAAAPALAFAADTDTGIYRPGANEIAFVTGGTERASFISQGLKLSNGGSTFTVPSIFANGDSDTGLALIGGNQLALVVGGATGLCFNASGNVLIGTTTDGGQKLQVNGDATFAGKTYTAAGAAATPAISFSGDTDSGFYNAGGNQVALACGGGQIWNTTVNGLSMASGKDIYLGNAYVAGAPTATGYVTIKDSAGTVYKVLVST